jgi:hypothetical protein
VILPAIFDDGGILCTLFARFAIVAYKRDDLICIVGIECNQRKVIYTINVSEILGLLL